MCVCGERKFVNATDCETFHLSRLASRDDSLVDLGGPEGSRAEQSEHDHDELRASKSMTSSERIRP